VGRLASEYFELMSRRMPALANELVEPFALTLGDFRRLCGGDLDKALIMLVIALRANRHPEFRSLGPDDLLSDDPPPLPSYGTNGRSIADATGIPRETVRRKVADLIEVGWVVRQGRKLHYSHEGYRAVAPARESQLRMYARAFQLISGLIEPPA
jgi:hypothetical protein